MHPADFGRLAFALLPPIVAAAAAIAQRLSQRRKDLQMTDLPTTVAPAPVSAPLTPAPADAPIATAPAAADPHAVVTSVVSSVQAHPGVAPSQVASVSASILAGLLQAAPEIFALTRSSQKTQTEVGLGISLAELILGAFLR